MRQRWDVRLLGPAIEATRAHLADLEQDQVPHALRSVNASSARRLPPPLAAVVVRELDRSVDLRAHVAELLPSGDDTLAGQASLVFVSRREGWEDQLDDLAASDSDRHSQADFDRVKDRVASLEAELARTRDKLKATKKQAATDATEARRRIADIKRQAFEGQSPGKQDAARLSELLDGARNEQEVLRERATQAEALVEKLRANLLRAKRSRGPSQAIAGLERVGQRPVDLAKSLDALALVAAVDHAGVTVASAESSGFGMPPGLRPDSPEAMEWVVKRAGPVTIVIDGYNAAWLIDPANFSTSEVRQEVVRRAALVRGAAVAPSKLIVVFDSEHGQAEPPPPGAVAVRWAASADDEVRSLAETLEGNVVVVSTDREVQEGSAEHGALVLWSEAFVGWSIR